MEIWNKPWPPEINWLDPYFNLSAVSQEIIDGIALGNRFTKFIRNASSSRFGWYAAIKINHDLADSYYIQHYMNTNKTMFVCVPIFGRMNLMIAYYPREFWANSRNYTLGIFKSREDWSYIFSDAYGGVRLKLALSAVGVIAATGLFGKFGRGSYCQYKVSVSHFFYLCFLCYICYSQNVIVQNAT